MTTLIIPSRCRVPLLTRCIESLKLTKPQPMWTIVLADQDQETYDYACVAREWPWWSGGLTPILSEQRLGLWQGLNSVFSWVALIEDHPFVFVGDDVVFASDWLAQAEACWKAHFPDGLGLLSFNDGIQFHGNASHFMTTRRWLYVIFGEPFFPREYWHHFCDSELTVRSRDGFGRYHYCESSIVTHHWEPSGQNYSLDHDDYKTKERRHAEWTQGGLAAARARLAEMQRAS